MKKKVGVLGSGNVAQVLAKGFLNLGYEVAMGTRNVSKLSDWKNKNPSANVVSFEDAVKFGDIVVLAVKGTAAESLIKSLASLLAGKIVIDTTNPIAERPPVNGVLQYFTSMNESLMERLQTLAPAANFVKAFNIVGNQYMVNPSFAGGKPTMFICGNSENARKEVTSILDSFGWEVEDLGKVEAARAIEPLCMLWCIPGILRGQWSHAFKLLK